MSDGNVRKIALGRLWWLADAPLFIDESLIKGFYDAVVRPEFELQGKTIGQINETTNKLLVGGAVQAGLGLPSFLSFLEGKANLKAKMEGSRQRRRQSSEKTNWKAVKAPGRHLEELVAVYVSSQQLQERLLFMECPLVDIKTLTGAAVTFDALRDANNSFPRSLVFLEVKPDAVIIPTMCEFARGGFEALHQQLIEKLWSSNETKPKYPLENDAMASPEKLAYWRAIAERYDSGTAMQVLESAAGESRKLEWVDFRLNLTPEGETLHLHVCPRGQYSAGTFGYNFIRRGNTKGVRIVGSLKRGPDLNVLAIFEC